MAKEKVNVSNAGIIKRAHYAEVLKKIQTGKFCPFCKDNLQKFHQKPIIFKGTHWTVTFNNWPYEGSVHHFLFIHRAHIEKLEAVSPKAWAELHVLYKKLAKKYAFTGATLFSRSGDTTMTGASVNHLHAQVIVGKKSGKHTEPMRAIVGFKKK